MEQNKDEIIKTAILKSAAEIFQKWGLNKTTMEDIAKAAGKGKSTLYYYYGSKEEIFYLVMLSCAENVINAARARINDKINAEDKIRTYIDTFISEIKKYTSLYEIVRGEIKDHPQLINKIRTRYDSEEIKLVADIIKFGIKNNEFREYPEGDINALAYSIITATRSLFLDLFIDNKIFYDIERINILLDILFNGIKK